MPDVSAENPMQLRTLRGSERELAENTVGAVRVIVERAHPGVSLATIFPPLSLFLAPGSECWGVFIKGTLVGTLAARATKENPAAWEIASLAVLPSWRGMGIGRMLAEEALQHARSQGAQTVRVSVHSVLESACGLFRSLRFFPEGSEPEGTGAFVMRRDF